VTPYYEQDGITIYHGDCREWLESVPACFRVDALITDPPYGVGYSKYASHDDDEDEYPAFILDVVERAERHIDNGYACVMQSAKWARRWHELIPREWRVIALPKTFVQMNMDKRMVYATDYALVWTIGETPKRPGVAPRDWFVCNTADMRTKVKGHPCPRPIDGMKYLVSCASEPGWTLLDPFAGSGTTLHAAKELGRRAIGIEIEERYCEIAAKRLSQGVLPLEMGA
jgi:site-specific DNA-methyltransferase (adenine-specific)